MALKADSRPSGAAQPLGPVWSRLPEDKPSRPLLTREAIIDAAVALADDEGLAAVSIRRVAAALQTSPMGLYSHFARKDDLIDLMIDRIIRTALLEEISGDWREALREIAGSTRAVALSHRWIIAAADRRATMGPNALRHLEQSLGAVEPLQLEPFLNRTLLRAIDTFTMGHVLDEIAELETPRRDGLSAAAWQKTATGYLDRLIDTGEFPHLARLGAGGLLTTADKDRSFETGLEWLLSGISTSLKPSV